MLRSLVSIFLLLALAGNAVAFDLWGSADMGYGRQLAYYPGSTNLVLQSSAFATSPWSTFNANTTLTAGKADPFGGTNAFQVDMSAANTGIKQDVAESGALVPWTASIWVKGDTSGTIRFFDANGYNPGLDLTASVTTDWQRFSVTGTKTTAAAGAQQLAIFRSSAGQLARVYIYGAQLEQPQQHDRLYTNDNHGGNSRRCMEVA